jgi:hypothetical protein
MGDILILRISGDERIRPSADERSAMNLAPMLVAHNAKETLKSLTTAMGFITLAATSQIFWSVTVHEICLG